MSKKDPKPKKLGRGLSALLGDAAVTPAETAPKADGVNTVPIEYLSPGKFQPRRHFDEEEIKSLSASIAERGILQPILVRPSGTNSYEIIAGERRWRAAQMARLHEVPVLIKQLSDEAVLEAALVENIQRADLSPLEEAAGYRRLLDEFAYTQEKLAQVIGKSRSHIANTLRLEALPEPVRKLLEEGKLTAGHARPLVGNQNAAAIAVEIVSKGLSVRQAEAMANGDGAPTKPGKGNKKSAGAKDPDTLALERSLGDLLGLKVTIDFKNEKGKISIQYQSLEQLDEVIQRLSGSAAG